MPWKNATHPPCPKNNSSLNWGNTCENCGELSEKHNGDTDGFTKCPIPESEWKRKKRIIVVTTRKE